MNPAPEKLKGEALRFTKQSMQYAFHIIDGGKDDTLNRILWFAAKGNQRYPSKLAGAAKSEEEDEDDD